MLTLRGTPINTSPSHILKFNQLHYTTRPHFLKPLTQTLKEFQTLGSGSVTLTPRYAPEIALIELRNAEKKNAMSPKMMVDLERVVGELEVLCQSAEEGRAAGDQGDGLVGVILSGEGGDLCSGFDLSSTPASQCLTPTFGASMSHLMHQTLHRLRRLPLISVASIDGHAIGGGAELSVSCDYRLITPNSRLKFVQIQMGVTPGWGGGVFLQSHLPHAKALEILGTAKSLAAEELRDLGLAHIGDPSPSSFAASAAITFMRNFTHDAKGNPRPAHVTREIKRVVSAGGGLGSEEEWRKLEREREVFVRLWGQAANRKAVERFVGGGKG